MNVSAENTQPVGATVPPAFWTALTEADCAVLEYQRRGRRTDSSDVLYVAARCRFGCPMVVVSSPVSSDGRPFPTIFWLTCPYLNRRCGELESAQQISELEKLFQEDPQKIKAYHSRYAKLRMGLLTAGQQQKLPEMNDGVRRVITESGIGGINWKDGTAGAKCLHLQTATWLGMGEHPYEEWLRGAIGEAECPDGICTKI